jgi:D-glycerate 3-kinase
MSKIPPELIERVLAHILPTILIHKTTHPSQPFILALAGPQGSGKTTWALDLASALSNTHGLKTIQVSLDDFYLDHASLVALRDADLSNRLFATRGHPGTHDEVLGREFFDSLAYENKGEVLVPSFDKSRFNGEGDRAPRQDWQRMPTTPAIDIVIFEGWCVGFRPLSDSVLEERWNAAKTAFGDATSAPGERLTPAQTLATHKLEHLRLVNENLRRYCEKFMGPAHFDYLLQLNPQDVMYIYDWRLQQEHAMKAVKGSGMTDEQVVRFVEGYMPGYALYLDDLRTKPFFADAIDGSKGSRQLQLQLDKSRVDTGIFNL